MRWLSSEDCGVESTVAQSKTLSELLLSVSL